MKSVSDIRERCRKNVLVFGKVCFSQMFSLPTPKFHHDIARVYHDKSKRKVNIIAPRDSAKSSLVACVFVLHHIFFDRGPKVVLLCSRTQGHAIKLLDTIKNALEYSGALKAIFGYWGMHSAKVWSKAEIVLKDGTAILCKGTGQMVVGTKVGNQRPTFILLDDPEDMENTKTAERMEFNLRWLLQSLVPARDAKRGVVWVIGTPQHHRCMVETLTQAGDWYSLRYRSIDDEGNALWPEKMSKEELLKEKAALEQIGRVSVWYRERQCQVIGDEDQLFRPDYIHWWDGELDAKKRELVVTYRDGALNQPLIVPVNVFMGVDPASSVAQTADYSTVVPVAIDPSMNRYILPYFRKRVPPLVLADHIIEMYDRLRPERSRIESTGYQEMLRDYIRERRVIPGFEIQEKPRTSKSVRLETLQPSFAQGKVFLKRGMQDFEDELLLYPRGKHDDLLDGYYYAVKRVYPPSGKVKQGGNDAPRRVSRVKGWLTS